ncbi:MAG: asparagine synthase (glutamine-hydrolyzing), partial [Planctomycetota bacterium]
DAGAQPMASSCGRFVLAYNGEIYNAAEIRDDLAAAGRTFRGHSDTEVLVEAIAEWGVDVTLPKLNGMFAFAVWDATSRTVTLARDRMGIKPLYYGTPDGGRTWLFGSELKPLREHPAFDAAIDRDALALLLRHGMVVGPRSIYRGVAKLPAGTTVTFRAAAADADVRPYWSLFDVASSGEDGPDGDLEALLTDAIGRRMVADVPVGAFLSGGVDSSLVVALMQRQSTQPVRTFSIGFGESRYNEADHAAAVAKHLGTDHTELYVTPDDALAVIPKLPTIYDEPFADSSQIPTYLVSELTRRSVTVSLSGDGGDELFAGYDRYRIARDVWKTLSPIPGPLRTLAAAVGTAVLRRLPGQTARKFARRADKLGVGSAGDVYCSQLIHWANETDLVLGADRRATDWSDPTLWPSKLDPIDQFRYADMRVYLPDDILTKVDRASMAVSLEARVPLLDHRVVEWVWRRGNLSPDGRTPFGKPQLKAILAKYVPRELFERPKMGFGVPIDVWLRGPLRDWAEALLDDRRLRDEGFFDPGPIRQRWREHLDGTNDWHYPLWNVLMFQAWREGTR